MTRNQQEIISYLNSKKIIYGFKTIYENGVAVKSEWMPVKIGIVHFKARQLDVVIVS
jgi:hypothetical protein